MDMLARDDIFSLSSLSLEEDVMIKKIMLTHDPDGRRLDAELLLHATENIICYATATQVSVPGHLPFDAICKNNLCNIEAAGLQEPLSNIIYRISREMIHCTSEGDLQARTLILFDLLGNYRWDAKVALVLAAFVITYGEFWLIMQLYPCNHLAALVATLKYLPSDLSVFKTQFKALGLLVKAMVDVTKCIIKFEGLPLQHVELDIEELAITKSQIYVATYWVLKSALTCSSQVTDLKAMKHEQVHSNAITIAAWELSSFVYKLSNICSCLKRQVEVCHQQIESKIYQKILILMKETHVDNQEVLSMLFTLKDDFPLKYGSSQSKLSVSELRNRIVLLLVSKPELSPTEALFFLVQQLCDDPHNKKLKTCYEIVWVPISQSDTWAESEEETYEYLSNSMPFYSIRRPWLLNKVVVQYIKQVWTFKDEALLVALDSQGVVTNSNAYHMVLIWGARAYPFSASRENELWEEEKWTIQFMIDQIDPLMTKWVKDGRNLCLYGGDNLNWVREFNAKMKVITSAGVQLEVVYVGNKNLSEQVNNILATINQEKLSGKLSTSSLQLFWLRLESMRKSNLRIGKKTKDSDHILEEVAALLEFNDNDKGWAVFGTGSSLDIVKLQGNKLDQCLDNFSVWGENVALLGILGALRTALEPPATKEPCSHSYMTPYVEGLIEKTMACDICKRPMEEFFVYQCGVIE